MHNQSEFRPRRPSQLNRSRPNHPVKGRFLPPKPKSIKIILKVFISLAFLAICWITYDFFINQSGSESIERDFINHSAYREIDTRHFEQKNATHDILIEYPITKYQKINQFLREKIDLEHQEFMDLTKKSPIKKQVFSEKISYQIPRQTDEFLSVVISILQDWQGAHPISRKLFWTFDKKTEDVIKLEKITTNQSAQQAILTKVKRKIISQNQSRMPNLDNFLTEALTIDKLENFVSTSDSAINFPFGQGVVAPESIGEIDVSLNISDLSGELQTDFARRIFNIAKINPDLSKTQSIKSDKPQIASVSCHNCVALTFDDGPGLHTSRLLDILAENGAKATFFILGPAAQKYQQITKRITDEGHTAANHSWTHSQFSKLNRQQVEDEIIKTNQAIKSTGAKLSPFFRPPYGIFDQTTIEVLKSQKMSVAMWSVDPRDWADRNSNLICQRAVTNAGSGSVILLHDIHKTSVDAVGCIISGLKNRGYKLVNFDQMFPSIPAGQVIYRAN